MSLDALDHFTKPIADYYSSISSATSADLYFYLPTRTAICFSLTSIFVSFLTFCVSFTLIRRPGRLALSHSQHFSPGTSGRFLHFLEHSPWTLDPTDSSFLYFSEVDFCVLQELAQETLRRPVSPNNISPINPHTDPHNFTTPSPLYNTFPPLNNHPPNCERVYPHITAPIYHVSSSQPLFCSSH